MIAPPSPTPPAGTGDAPDDGAVGTEVTSQRIGDLLVARGAVTPAQLLEALVQQQVSDKRLGEMMVELGVLDGRTLASVLGEQYGMDVVDLRSIVPDTQAVGRIPEAMARRLNILAVRQLDGILEVATSEPQDRAMASELSMAVAPMQLRLVIAPTNDISRAIDTAYRALSAVGSLVDAFEATDALRKATESLGGGRAVADDAPVVRVVNLIVTQGVRDRASDIHIEPQGDRVRVRFRIDGALHDQLALPQSIGPALVSRIKIMADMNIVERRRAQDGQMVMQVDGRSIDIRLATSPTIWGEKAVLRLLDRNRTLLRLDDLGMTADLHDSFSKLMRAPYGLVICAGPTGSGKTTTLYATLTEINQADRNVTTIEDPVEYVIASINQIQINEQAGINFAAGLRAILRQDPDVILVGEIRDAETARIAVESALTGHFVLSSVHATDAASALQRLVDMGIEPFLLASTVTGMVSQRLVRRTCDQCKVPYEPSVEELAFYDQYQARTLIPSANGSAKASGKRTAGATTTAELAAVAAATAGGGGADTKAAGAKSAATKSGTRGAATKPHRPPKFSRGIGCNFCSRTGFRERGGAFELLTMTDEVKTLLVSGSSVDLLRAAAVRGGMRTLLDSGMEMVERDETTIGEIMRSVYIL